MSKKKSPYTGTWRIIEMEMWDSDYLDAEVPAYITIKPDGSGEFQFGYVSGGIFGEIDSDSGAERFEFTWEGSDEMDAASGSGWLRPAGGDRLEGKIRFHRGDSSGLVAERQKT